MIYVIETEHDGIVSAFKSKKLLIHKLKQLPKTYNVRTQVIDNLIYAIEQNSKIWETFTIWEDVTTDGEFVGVEDTVYIKSFYGDEDLLEG